jgi:hypothetical protein
VKQKAACGRCCHYRRAKPHATGLWSDGGVCKWDIHPDGSAHPVDVIVRHDVLRDGCRGYRKRRKK